MTANAWWRSGIIYQIYPRSFKDSNNDGIGDLQGIISKLDYLKALGIKAIWLSPCFKSPMKDFGYDISDYKDIDPIFGTLKDMDILINEAHQRNIKVILDYVANHTSDQHPWFQESKKSKTNPKSAYYIWKDAKPDGSEPNNWLSAPGSSVWEWDEGRQQYYYHSFLACQPDVNWNNPELRNEMLNVLRFWLDKGIDGFRIDMISWLCKDPQWRDNPINPNYDPNIDRISMKLLRKYTVGQPCLFEYLEMISKTVQEYPDKVIIGEISYSEKLEEHAKYFGKDGNLVHLPANFEFTKNTFAWKKDVIISILNTYYNAIPSFGWTNFQFNNHDRSRMATRLGSRDIARVAAVLLLTLKGTPFMYNGEELGMIDVPIPEDKVQDPTAKIDSKLSRDAYRTPLQWNDDKYAGFSTVEPWLPVSDDYKKYNAQTENNEQKSFLNLYKKLIELRNTHETLRIGGIEFLDLNNSNCLGYTRTNATTSSKEFGIFINFSDEKQEIAIDNRYDFILSSYLDNKNANDNKNDKKEKILKLRKNEAIIVKLVT